MSVSTLPRVNNPVLSLRFAIRSHHDKPLLLSGKYGKRFLISLFVRPFSRTKTSSLSTSFTILFINTCVTFSSIRTVALFTSGIEFNLMMSLKVYRKTSVKWRITSNSRTFRFSTYGLNRKEKRYPTILTLICYIFS